MGAFAAAVREMSLRPPIGRARAGLTRPVAKREFRIAVAHYILVNGCPRLNRARKELRSRDVLARLRPSRLVRLLVCRSKRRGRGALARTRARARAAQALEERAGKIAMAMTGEIAHVNLMIDALQ